MAKNHTERDRSVAEFDNWFSITFTFFIIKRSNQNMDPAEDPAEKKEVPL
jgi:hypothetical protein